MDDPLEMLVQRAQAGDREAADELVRRLGGRVRASIRRRLRPELRRRVESEDIFQSAMVLSLEDLPKFTYRGEQALVAWLSKVAERRVIDAARHHRAGKRDVRREQQLAAAFDLTGGRTSPTQGAVRTEVSEGIRQAVDRLPEPERQAVELHAYEGLTHREVAERMDLSDKYAAHRLFRRALKKMGDFLDADVEGPSAPSRPEH